MIRIYIVGLLCLTYSSIEKYLTLGIDFGPWTLVSLRCLEEDSGSGSGGFHPRAFRGAMYCTRLSGMPARGHNLKGRLYQLQAAFLHFIPPVNHISLHEKGTILLPS